MDSKRILIVEDERQYAEMVRLRLELAGYVCAISEDTQQGIRAWLEDQFDLVVLDLMLPGGGGFAILHEVRKHPAKANIPVVILTGKTVTTEMKAMMGTYRVDALFTKPYDPERFTSVVQTLLV